MQRAAEIFLGPVAAAPGVELLPMRPETVRRLVGVGPAEEAHPSGIWRSRIDERHHWVPAD